MRDYLSELNEQQREAVLHIDGPLMILAGAGSGKTKVLTTRIIHLMANGVDAFNILALTFTNKAAREMRERVEQILGNSEARNLYIGTFHSVFARILRVEAEKIGYPRNFTIYDTDDAKSVLKTVINELNLDDKHYKPNIIYHRISSAKNALISPAEYRNDYVIQQEDFRANRPATALIYEAYTKRCFKNGAMDFDDLLMKFYELLKNIPEALSRYQRKFRYILIDEYQDTNPAQYEIVKLLGAMHENVCVVGDDAQSIYSFRGATIQNILQFRKDYEDVKIVKLEQNYRSTQNILDVANEVIKNNKNQIEKMLFTRNSRGEKIKLVRAMSDNDEGKFVADCIQEQKLRNHYSNKDFAVLYRTNAQSRAFEEALRRMGIAYSIYGGISFFQRKEIKDLLAYLRFLVNPRDNEALIRIINYPTRGIGTTTINKLLLIANENDIPVWEVLVNASDYGFKAATLKALNDFVTMMKCFAGMLKTHNAYEVAFQVGKQTGLVKELFDDKSAEGVQRYEHIQELLNSIKEWTVDESNKSRTDDEGVMTEDAQHPASESGEASLATYLQHISLLTDADRDDPDADTVKLMTIHAAKGLEFKCVFVVGLEEMLFPNILSINSREELEEERRLFYVAITRAKEKLWISYANSRYRFGHLIQNEPSRFINEIPEQYFDKNFDRNELRKKFYQIANSSSSKPLPESSNPKTTLPPVNPVICKTVSPVTEHIPSPDFTPSDTSHLLPGQRVEHLKFGFGLVTKIEGAPNNPIATVNFEHNGEKKIMLKYARLRIVK